MTWYLSYGGPKGPTPSGPPVPSPFPNSGRILQNPTFLFQSGGYEFLNLMKMAQMPWAVQGGSFTASISGTTMTVTAVSSGGIGSGVGISGTGVTSGTFVLPLGHGGTTGTGGTGTYALNISQTVASESMSCSGNAWPGDLDSNGYPTALNSGYVTTNIYVPDTSIVGANYVATWTGNGTIGIGGSILTGGNFTGSGGVGMAQFSIPAGGATFMSVFITALPVTNLVIFNASDQGDITAGKITGSKLRSRIAQARTPVWRNLNWSFGNATQVSSWAHRKPVGYVSYAGDEYKASLFAGDAGNGAGVTVSTNGLDYSATLGSGSPTDKQIITFMINSATANPAKAMSDSPALALTAGTPGVVTWNAHGFTGNEPIGFSNDFHGFNTPLDPYKTYYVVGSSVTANTFEISLTPGGAAIGWVGTSTGVVAARLCTLNLNGTGTVPIRDQLGAVFWPSGYNNQFVVNTLYTSVYEVGVNAWMAYTIEALGGHFGLLNGVPPETFVQFCAELGCHPWFDSPYYACDPMTDWHIQLATYCKTNAPSWMIPRFETVNEPWNTNTPAGQIPLRMSDVNWGQQSMNDWIGKISSTIGQDLSSVYGTQPDGTRYWCIPNMQTGSGPQNDLMNCPLYTGQAAGPQTGYTKTPAKNWITHVCINQYFFYNEYSSVNTTASTAAGNNVLTVGNGVLSNPTWIPNSFTLTASATVTSGSVLQFSSVPQTICPGTVVSDTSGAGTQITAGTQVSSITATTVTLSAPINSTVTSGDVILFGIGVFDFSGAGTQIPAGAVITSTTATSITMSKNAASLINSGDFIGFTVSNTQQERQNWLAAAGNPTLQQTYVDELLDDAINGVNGSATVNGGCLSALLSAYQSIGNWAPTFTNNAGKSIGLCGYEGGFAASDTTTADFKLAQKKGTHLGTYYEQNVANFYSAGGVFPAEFTISAPIGSNDDWSILLDIYMSPDPPQWVAIVNDH